MRLVIALLILAASLCCGWARERDALRERGEKLAQDLCAGCHAVGRTGQSPHAGAPAFRALDRRLDLDGFAERLRGGLTSGHPDMPTFRFTRQDARALVAYLRFIQGP